MMASAVVLYPFSKQNNMVRVNQSSDKIIRMLTLAGELVVFNLLLVLLYAVYAHYSGTYPPSYKRLMLLMSVIYGLVNLQSGMVLHHRFVKAEEIFSRIISTLFPFILISLLVLWAMRWPLFTWSFMCLQPKGESEQRMTLPWALQMMMSESERLAATSRFRRKSWLEVSSPAA